MKLDNIPTHALSVQVNDLWLNRWFLLTSGDWNSGHYNTMTVAWGFFGIMWNKPVAAVVVRPGRHTYEFIEKHDNYTLSAFPSEFQKDLTLLGTKSGRDGDKISETKLTPVQSCSISSPAFKEAELIIECKKIYWDDFKPEHFMDKQIDKSYPLKDYHRIYFGEILNISGLKKYSSKS